jgi:hypothetical protein
MREASIPTAVTPWDSCCLFFQIDPNRVDMAQRVQIAGLKIGLYQYQAFAVYWMILNSRKSGGAFLADSPGLGKTLTTLAVFVVERQLSILRADIEKSRTANDRRHLQVIKQWSSDSCPTLASRPGWILCPCMMRSPAYRWDAKPGARLVLVPNSLIPDWRKAWKESIDTRNTAIGMRLFVAHQYLTDISTKEMAFQPANINILKAKKSPHDSFVLLATAQSFPPLMKKFESVTQKNHFHLSFGIAVEDECHEDYFLSKGGRADAILQLPGNPFCYGLSGTPYNRSPRALVYILQALETYSTRAWEGIPHLSYLTVAQYEALCDKYNDIVKSRVSESRTELDNLKERLLTFLTTFMIRRTSDSRWFGHHLVSLPNRTHQDITFEHTTIYDEELEKFEPIEEAHVLRVLQDLQRDQWDNLKENRRKLKERPTRLSFENNILAHYQSMIFASCQALVDPRMKGMINFTSDEIVQWVNAKNEFTKENPYYDIFMGVFVCSPKITWVWRTLMQLQKLKDDDGGEIKVVIISSYLPVIYMVKLVRSFQTKHRAVTNGYKDDSTWDCWQE